MQNRICIQHNNEQYSRAQPALDLHVEGRVARHTRICSTALQKKNNAVQSDCSRISSTRLCNTLTSVFQVFACAGQVYDTNNIHVTTQIPWNKSSLVKLRRPFERETQASGVMPIQNLSQLQNCCPIRLHEKPTALHNPLYILYYRVASCRGLWRWCFAIRIVNSTRK